MTEYAYKQQLFIEIAKQLGYKCVVKQREYEDVWLDIELIDEHIIYDAAGEQVTFRRFDAPNRLEESAWRNNTIPKWPFDLNEAINLMLLSRECHLTKTDGTWPALWECSSIGFKEGYVITEYHDDPAVAICLWFLEYNKRKKLCEEDVKN